MELRYIGLRGVDVLLETDKTGRANWYFSPKDSPAGKTGTFKLHNLDIKIRIDKLEATYKETKKSGSSFAFPSQTLYMGRDDGLDGERGETAAKEVESWRKAGKLPFPRLAADRIEQLKGTLDYPPRGSVEAGTFKSQVWETSERLSAEPDDEEESDRKPPSQKRGDDS